METDIFELMEQKQLTTANGKIAYWLRRGAGNTLVFMHGLSADHTLFRRQLEYFLPNSNCNLLCWDAPAHALSRPYRNFSYADAAAALDEILKAEKLERPVLIGQSMGGYIAQSYMLRYPGAAGFIGIDTCPYGTGYYTKGDLWWLDQMEWMCACFPHRLLVYSLAKSCTCTDAAYRNMLQALGYYGKKELCHLLGIGYAEFSHENCDMEITCPAVIIVGEKDKTGKVRQYCRAWHEKTGLPLHIIPRAAHNSNYDNPEAVNRIIENFVTENII